MAQIMNKFYHGDTENTEFLSRGLRTNLTSMFSGSLTPLHSVQALTLRYNKKLANAHSALW
jgi:hypothetical protein